MVTFRILTNPGLFNNYEHTIDFADIETQTAFWNARTEATFGEGFKCNFLNNNKIIIEGDYNSFRHSSYCCADVVVNGSTKRYYYFITNIQVAATLEPESLEQVMELTIEEDVMQTYMFDYSIKESFVEREHQDRVQPDGKRIFSHTPENIFIPTNKKTIQTGELHSTDSNGDLIMSNLKYLVVQFTQSPKWFEAPQSFSVLTTLMVPFIEGYPDQLIYLWNGTESIVGLNSSPTYNDVIKYVLDDTNTVSCNVILCGDCKSLQYNPNIGWLFEFDPTLYSREAFNVEGVSAPFYTLLPKKVVEKKLKGFIDSNSVLKTSTLPNYQNDAQQLYESKLYTSPFTEAILQLNTTTHVYDPAWIGSFEVNYCANTIGAVSEVFYPSDLSENIDGTNTTIFNQSFSENEIPIENNEWEQYLAQNKSSIRANQIAQGIQLGSSIVGGTIGALTGSPVGLLGGFAGVVNTMTGIMKNAAQMEDLKNKNPSAINTGSSYFIYSNRGLNNCRWTINQISGVDLERVYKFLMVYGYAAFINKIPHLQSRYYYNYIKMQAGISGKLNTNIIEKFTRIFEKGVTIWHYRDADTFLFNDYSKENQEMSLMENANG